MPNYNKSFNFRNGVQVDVDDLIVRGNLVGIGTTIPRADLDVRGIVDVTGIVTTSNLFVSGISTFADEIHIGTGITISPQTGIISASFRGDASFLDNLPTSQWVDVDPGLGYTSIYNTGPVGVGTTNPIQTFQVGGNPDNPLHFGVGIDSTRGNIRTTGIITAASFVGSGLGITGITADNITSGNLDSARLPTSFFGLGEIGATNLAISGVGTFNGNVRITAGGINVTGVGTFTDIESLNSFTVAGVSTFNNDIIFTGDSYSASWDKSANTLNLSDNAKATFGTGNDLQIYFDGSVGRIDSETGDLYIRNSGTNDDSNIYIQAKDGEDSIIANDDGSVELFYDNSKKFETTGVGATVTGDLQVSRHSSILGVSTLTSVSASDATIGISTLTNVTATDIAVQKLTVSGVTTFAAAVDANAGATIDNIQIGITDDNEIDTTTGNLTIDSAGGTTTIDDNLGVSGTVSISDNTSINGSLDINGGVAVTGILTVSSQINPTTTNTVGLGTAGTVYSDAFIGDITVGAATSSTITTRNESLTLDSAQGTVIVDDDFNVTGVSTLTSLTVATATVSANVLPNSDKSVGLGTNGTAFSEAFIGELTVGVAASNTVSTRSGSLQLDSVQGTVIVQDDFNVSGVSTLPTLNSTTVNTTSITSSNVTVSTSLSPSTDQAVPLGTTSLRYSELHVDNIRVGVGSDQEIIATTGNLELKAPGGNVRITNLEPVGIVTVSGDVLPDGDKTRDLGSSTTAYAQVHVDELRLGVTANTLDTRTGDLNLNSASGNTNVNDKLVVNGDSSITGSAFIGAGGTGFAILGSDQRIGIGTSAPTSSIQAVNYGNTNISLISENATSSITLSRDLTGSTNDTATIEYNGTDFTISNKDAAGNIVVDMATGSGINTSSEFKVTQSGSDLLVVTHDGLLGVNNSTPAKELDVTGDLLVSNDAVITGILTIGTGAGQISFGSGNNLINTNINSSSLSGVSTIVTLETTSFTVETINASGIITALGGNFVENISVGNTGTFLSGGTIGTDARAFVADDTLGDALTVRGSTSIRGNLFAAYAGSDIGSVGIGTTNYPLDTRDTGTTGNLNIVEYGNFSITGNMSVIGEEDNGTCIFVPSKNDTTVPTLKKNNAQSEFSWTREFKVGINTYVPRSAFDIGACNSPMIVPSLSQQSITELVTTLNNATMTDPALPSGSGTQVIGGLFFSKPENRLKVGLATANSEDSYVGILTVTANSSDFEAISFPQMTTANRNTMNTAGGIPDGSVIYNTSTNKLQVKASGSFVDLH